MAKQFGASYDDFMEGMPGAFGLTTGRLVEPEEVASLITFLASPITPGLVGAEVVIDSGASQQV